jgi:HAD superfamily hydrolase (TIGR01509 family)
VESPTLNQIGKNRKPAVLANVIFDMDGVLFDSHPLHLRNWQQILREEGRFVVDAQLEVIYEGVKREEILRQFLGLLSPAESARLGRRKDELFQQLEGTLQTVPGLAEFLLVLEAAGIPKAVVTSASRSRTLRLLDRFRLTPRFAAIVTGCDVPNGKEDPSIFRMALSRLGVAPEHCLVIEDSRQAIYAACQLGIRCVGIASGARSRRLADAGADHVVPDFTALRLESIA